MRKISLADKYDAVDGDVFISGAQAIVRILLDQRRRDRVAGLATAGFVSGYRGSPLGGVDHALWQAGQLLQAHDIVFTPGVNEELAATAVYGTQHLSAFGRAKVEGVFSAWYGKGPGVDRAGDALKHGNLAGASAKGGVLVFAGDDHQAKSSTTAHQSEQALQAAFLPILYPATVAEFPHFGAFGYALSRFSGLWVGFKCVNETADATMTARLPELRMFVNPTEAPIPADGLNFVPGDSQIMMERRTVEFRLPAAQAFARTNGIDREIWRSPRPALAVVTAGKAYLDVREALGLLGLDEAAAKQAGISLLKLGMVWPAAQTTLLEFCAGHREALVVEEKRAVVEPQVKEALYHLSAGVRPDVSGKRTPQGAPLLTSSGELSPVSIALAIADRLIAIGAGVPDLAERACALSRLQSSSTPPTQLMRAPFFCSGCPHNTSTTLPEGAVGLSGIGCHVMAAFMPHRKHVWPVQMGGEGANWVGAAPFSSTTHVFQNLGDGTLYHSGLLAIRSAVAAGVNITYKILFNDAVAMTGGQPVEGVMTPLQIARELQQEGVKSVVIVADDPGRYEHLGAARSGLRVLPRTDFDAVQKELAAVEGVTALIYDQVCAAELRRRRKRGLAADPARRLFINEGVCEGCGDCGVASNCVSLQPVETEFGRKRRIDQSSCNKDQSCLNGFCPSFVTLDGAKLRTSAGEHAALEVPALPEPAVAPASGAYAIMVAGIGGTGVITIGAVLGMAAHLEGKCASVMDMTGLSQKNGAVFSHVKIGSDPDHLHAARLGPGEADLLLACDVLAAAAPEAQQTLADGKTAGVVNTTFTPTAAFTFSPDMDFGHTGSARALAARLRDDSFYFDAGGIITKLMGDAILANMFALGVAVQRGGLPVSLRSLERAIELNGVAVAQNLAAFRLGRWACIDAEAVRKLAQAEIQPKADEGVDALIARRAGLLKAYQNDAYASQFTEFMRDVLRAERSVAPESTALSRAVALGLSKLMAYKDEYEVARLFGPEFKLKVDQIFAPGYRMRFHMAPPIVAPLGADGHPRKMTFGPWMWGVLQVLARLKWLRGTPFDPFGWTAERRAERALIQAYRTLVRQILQHLSRETLEDAVKSAESVQAIRGYGHVKLRSMNRVQKQQQSMLAALVRPQNASASDAEMEGAA